MHVPGWGEEVGRQQPLFGSIQAPLYKKQYKQEFQCINTPGGCEEVCNQWID